MNIASTLTNIAADVEQGFNDNYPHAIYRLLVNGTDIGTMIQDRLMRITITDNRGIETDSIEIELSDHDGLLDIPPKGAEIEAWIGWSNTGLVYKGKYLVKERGHQGAPDILTLRAEAADLKTAFKKKKERSFDKKTIADIIQTIALEHGLNPIVNETLGIIELPHIDQNESDANLITRIADEHDAIAMVKNGNLLFMPKGEGKTISGNLLPEVVITRSEGDSHQYSDTDGADDVSGVTVYYYDNTHAKRQKVTVGMSDQNTRELRNIQRDKQTAEHVAKAEFNKIKSKSATFSFTLAYGRPELIPESPISFIGFKPLIDDIVWLGTRVIHEYNESGGYTTKCEAEVYLPDTDSLSELIDNERGGYTGILAYYKNGINTATVTKGDQTTPKRLTYLYKNRQTATAAADREYKALQDEKNQ
ncbi:Phage late control gene D protein [Acinetobacter venetianus]|uniref:Phage late control gene D protein n=1 Tax=Acinetobacter venetianus TaxID=52133 RepID=A0A150HKC8_9GAMM|nr:contractile injection system protein, VgrG/Pvc8 family [Acinetobacter venetianus]KXZ63223.1 Phage late control gene D protein [Acinetobacter venetianus]